jgi:hypothetical protein
MDATKSNGQRVCTCARASKILIVTSRMSISLTDVFHIRSMRSETPFLMSENRRRTVGLTSVRTLKTNYQLQIADGTILMLALIPCHYDPERKD